MNYKRIFFFLLLCSGTICYADPIDQVKATILLWLSLDEHFADDSWYRANESKIFIKGTEDFQSQGLKYFRDRQYLLNKEPHGSMGENFYIGTPEIVSIDASTESFILDNKAFLNEKLYIAKILYKVIATSHGTDNGDYTFSSYHEVQSLYRYVILAKDHLDGLFKVLDTYPVGGNMGDSIVFFKTMPYIAAHTPGKGLPELPELIGPLKAKLEELKTSGVLKKYP